MASSWQEALVGTTSVDCKQLFLFPAGIRLVNVNSWGVLESCCYFKPAPTSLPKGPSIDRVVSFISWTPAEQIVQTLECVCQER